MLRKLQEHIQKNLPFLKGKKILIAISGGLDSVVLTTLFSELEFDIALAHCNFKLRNKDSNLDKAFVKELGNNLGLKTFTTNFDTKDYATNNKLSTQVAARELRYSWFQELVTNHQFDYVLTAHHADDNLETFLINLTRGSGLEGLTGIPAINGNIVRPLLSFSREEIYQYAKENNIEWREDISNSETKYLRNKIRHEIVPKLKEINTSLLDSFAKTSEFLQQSQQIVDDRIENVSEMLKQVQHDGVIKIDVLKIQQLSNPKAYLYQFLKAYNFTEWNDIENLLNAQSGKQVFSKTHRLLKDRNVLLLSEISTENDFTEIEILATQTAIKEPVQLEFSSSEEKIITNSNVIFVDKDLLNYPLTVRKWQKGDYFYPSGMRGKKKLSKFFKDEKLSLLEKENIWLLCNSKNEVIWVIGKRQDNRFIANKKTSNILKIKHLNTNQ